MRKSTARLFAALAILAPAAAAPAALVTADFNDITAGAINGKSGGTGWTTSWGGSSGGNVVAGNLTSSLYNVPQSGTAQRFRNTNNTGLRQNFRNPTALTGTIWFSFLAMTEDNGDRAGLSINTTDTGTPFATIGNNYAYLTDDTLNYSFGSGTAGTSATAFPAGQTNLIVGRIILDGGTANADPTTLWLNPDLIANPDINTITPVYNNAAVDWLSTISVIGAIAAREDGAATVTGGNLDNIRFSDGGGNPAQALADVTNVPEPTTLSLLALTTLPLLRRARRH